MAIEDELVSCATCAGIGIQHGDLCPDCRGRGIVRVSHAIVTLPEDDDPEEEPKPIENLNKAQLVELAESLGLDAKGRRDELIERIQASRLAPPVEAAADVSDTAPDPVVDPGPNAADATPAEVADAFENDVDADADVAGDDGLEDLTVAELRDRAKAAGLDAKGRRDELIERLRS